jgi:hypothetical protein
MVLSLQQPQYTVPHPQLTLDAAHDAICNVCCLRSLSLQFKEVGLDVHDPRTLILALRAPEASVAGKAAISLESFADLCELVGCLCLATANVLPFASHHHAKCLADLCELRVGVCLTSLPLLGQ